MRVNTDGVLVGAVANHVAPAKILDVGTGTGIIALMLAQRFPGAKVTGIEMEEGAAATAERNFDNSAFADRMMAIAGDFLTFSTSEKFDLIVSNPPFFVNDLKNTSDKKGMARHTDAAFFEGFAAKAHELLSYNGLLWIVIPPAIVVSLRQFLVSFGLNLVSLMHISSFEGTTVFRQIAAFSRSDEPTVEGNFMVYEKQGVHSQQYKTLLKDFFLAF